MTDAPNNIIDLMPYIEGQKFGWTVDMTHAVLQHGHKQVLEPKPASTPVVHGLILNKEEFLKP